ncbi:hypothetical protein [Bacillus gaemokensis]|uniref:hypothetical protein n=1 Tax=Bacillus gaemokensis TaxID=574375 RepID=UPI00079653FC|nr:hypothetical protein [Bacillus gaemokensis]KYG37293.1 hypothetical protein AZF08_07765 [Bacillus gaemokensis]
MDFESTVGFFSMVLPFFIVLFVLRWIRFLYQNSEKQVKQNEQIIELLNEIKQQNEK